MIALAKSCSGGGSLLNYIMSDKKGLKIAEYGKFMRKWEYF